MIEESDAEAIVSQDVSTVRAFIDSLSKEWQDKIAFRVTGGIHPFKSDEDKTEIAD